MRKLLIYFCKAVSSIADINLARMMSVKGIGGIPRDNISSVNPFGIDGNPLPDMEGVYSSTTTDGRNVIIGYTMKGVNAGNAGVLNPGETYIYSLDPETRQEAANIILSNNGLVRVANQKGNWQLNDNGYFDLYTPHTHVKITDAEFGIDMESGGNIKLLGGTNHAVQYEALQTAMVTYLALQNAAIHSAVPGYTAPSAIDLSAAKEDHILIP